MQRLKTRPQFQAVLGGELVAKTTHFALHRVDLDASNPADAPSLFPVKAAWIGAMAPKRWAKRAVTRNAIKRQIYTVSASLQENCQHVAFLVRLRREFSRQEFPSALSAALKTAIRSELMSLLQASSVEVNR